MDIKLVSSLFVFLIVNSVLLHFICVKLSFGYILFMRKIKNLVSLKKKGINTSKTKIEINISYPVTDLLTHMYKF